MKPPNPLDGYGSALRDLTDAKFLASEKYGYQQMRADRQGCVPEILDFEKRFVSRMRKLGIPVFAHSMMRDEGLQTELFVKGVTKAKFGQSAHNYGMAVDIVHGTRAWDITRKQWEIFGHVGNEVAIQAGLKMEWGGKWNFWDPAHWELEGWRERVSVQNKAS